MSADNFYIIRNHPSGGYAAVMGFASDVDDNYNQIYPDAREIDKQFKTIKEAEDWAFNEYSEYGVDIHPECVESKSVYRRIKYMLEKRNPCKHLNVEYGEDCEQCGDYDSECLDCGKFFSHLG